MKNIKLAIIGAGGHTRSLLNLICKKKFDVIGIYDDSYNPLNQEEIDSVKLLGKIDEIPKEVKKVLSIGDNNQRNNLFDEFRNSIYKGNIISNSSIINTNVNIGESNQIFDRTYIDSFVKLGNNNILNIGSILAHETVIGNHNHISIGASLMGRAKIGNNCFIGAGATIIDKIKITDNVIIGANSLVINDISCSGTYVGNPVRKIK